jgi:hypothetical protein
MTPSVIRKDLDNIRAHLDKKRDKDLPDAWKDVRAKVVEAIAIIDANK